MFIYFVSWIYIFFDEKWPQCYTPQLIVCLPQTWPMIQSFLIFSLRLPNAWHHWYTLHTYEIQVKLWFLSCYFLFVLVKIVKKTQRYLCQERCLMSETRNHGSTAELHTQKTSYWRVQYEGVQYEGVQYEGVQYEGVQYEVVHYMKGLSIWRGSVWRGSV